MVERIYGTGVFYEDAVNDVYPRALEEAIEPPVMNMSRTRLIST